LAFTSHAGGVGVMGGGGVLPPLFLSQAERAKTMQASIKALANSRKQIV